MLLDEFVDFRVRAGETERQGVERERARRVHEQGWWLRSLTRARGAATKGASASGASAAGASAAGASAAIGGSLGFAGVAADQAGTAKQAGQREPELAHVGP